MMTYPRVDASTGRTVGFEIDNVYLGLSAVAGVLSGIQGVTDVKRRRLFSKWEEIHAWFRFMDAECFVWEPHGDNSRYWIGQKDGPEPIDISRVENAFKAFEPPLHRKLIGDLITLRFLKRLGGRNLD